MTTAGSRRQGMLSLEELRVEADGQMIDTVLLVFTDMQGRLAGKRLSTEYFLEEVAPGHAEGCNYLLAVDVEMNTVGGYAMSSWERGYGDFALVPDLSTLRRVPWQPAQRAQVRHQGEVPVATLPRGHRVPADGVHLHVDGE